MNDIFKSNIKARIEKAIEKEGVNQATAAQSIGIAACYVSHIKNPENWDKVPVAAWVIANKWTNSGQTLKEYAEKKGKVMPEPEGPEEHSPESVFGEEKETKPAMTAVGISTMKDGVLSYKNSEDESTISLSYYKEQADKANQKIRELTEENNRLIMQLTQPQLLAPLTGSQKLTVDLEVNLVIRVRKVEVEQ